MCVHTCSHDHEKLRTMHPSCFLMAWNIHVTCNLLCAMHGIVTLGVTMHVTEKHIGKYLTMPYI